MPVRLRSVLFARFNASPTASCHPFGEDPMIVVTRATAITHLLSRSRGFWRSEGGPRVAVGARMVKVVPTAWLSQPPVSPPALPRVRDSERSKVGFHTRRGVALRPSHRSHMLRSHGHDMAIPEVGCPSTDHEIGSSLRSGLILLVPVLLAFAGCIVGPNYQRPK